uniref:Uncharacterized protein n=1 Tax=Arundo donax TaxID=35708 RepID=A0A0A9BMA8_ARUDO
MLGKWSSSCCSLTRTSLPHLIRLPLSSFRLFTVFCIINFNWSCRHA